MRNSQRSAFTLLELLLVLTIIVILGAIAIPALEGIQNSFRLESSVDQIKARFAEARAHAIEENQDYRFAVQPDTSKYRIAPDSSDYWDGGTGGGTSTTGTTIPGIIIEEEIEKDVLFKFADNSNMSSDSGGWTTVAVFQPIGTCRNDAEIRFELEGVKPITVKIRALTGIITTKRAGTEESP
ncbi:prepilin-type N-terminal cleavage/methylation domain-containing protein [Telmatocola sphagniphila]|jgi:prepilin-type N-terminal cleavage/methylation domain-containing protein|uniref:Prepilin-type N-terminal cleavage/methylation domain-containing protein n=1 Tax=Telmatocola sphagniphila TaxID=1123043 RepID=A0A8E6F035_9BACT|nr:prepilin-type N-terminal cleavage/methylation domain-containing protein [Telmatocola sphagniphila]QVL34373.1 prepilin-type N-terminal cleavage/methylation domain-containing protein [Telmatocola sphagniphila]